jgi:hypothetical protein
MLAPVPALTAPQKEGERRLSLFILLPFSQSPLLHPVMQIGLRRVVPPGNELLSRASAEEGLHLWSVGI